MGWGRGGARSGLASRARAGPGDPSQLQALAHDSDADFHAGGSAMTGRDVTGRDITGRAGRMSFAAPAGFSVAVPLLAWAGRSCPTGAAGN